MITNEIKQTMRNKVEFLRRGGRPSGVQTTKENEASMSETRYVLTLGVLRKSLIDMKKHDDN